MAAELNTLIVLEDDPKARAALCLVLSDWDFQPVAAAHAAEALDALAGGLDGVVAVITDFDLGDGRTGVGETRALIDAGLRAPVLVISGSFGGRAVEAARAAGFQFLPKPVMPVDIRRWLDAELGSAA
jgi:DNA-binding NtrC family response regulator